LDPILRQRLDCPLFIIDIAVPRNVDPEVNQLGSVYLYDMDSLQSVAQRSLELRRQQISAAEVIITEHVANFQEMLARDMDWRVRNNVLPPIAPEARLRASES
jgi:glutamyl-tRNA reductase